MLAAAVSGAPEPARAETEAGSDSALCLMLESAAQANRLPLEFLMRVIWRESRFKAGAIGPRTRSGARAEGIAQFMPSTAAERNLDDPFNPVLALPQAAAYLRELDDAFGNLGLAAAAYNAGPQRLRGYLAGTRTMPDETRRYVLAITGRDVDEWARTGPAKIVGSQASCAQTLAVLGHTPGDFVVELERRATAAAHQPWGVQLAAGFSRQRVLGAYARAMARLTAVIGDRDPVLTRAVLRSRGSSPLFQARIGADTRGAADGLCAKIHSAGGACVVLRNPVARG